MVDVSQKAKTPPAVYRATWGLFSMASHWACKSWACKVGVGQGRAAADGQGTHFDAQVNARPSKSTRDSRRCTREWASICEVVEERAVRAGAIDALSAKSCRVPTSPWAFSRCQTHRSSSRPPRAQPQIDAGWKRHRRGKGRWIWWKGGCLEGSVNCCGVWRAHIGHLLPASRPLSCAYLGQDACLPRCCNGPGGGGTHALANHPPLSAGERLSGRLLHHHHHLYNSYLFRHFKTDSRIVKRLGSRYMPEAFLALVVTFSYCGPLCQAILWNPILPCASALPGPLCAAPFTGSCHLLLLAFQVRNHGLELQLLLRARACMSEWACAWSAEG